ncbi:hypothetical protein ES705_22710 [subsurface metagenome]|nr:PIN domain-containing protein [Methanosarcinales archaeon]
MLDKIESGTRVFIDLTSVLVCNEVFHRTMIAEVVEKYEIEPKSVVSHLKKNWSIITELRKPWVVMLNIRQIATLELLEVNEADFEVALSYSKKYGLLSNDAFHVATMKRHGITNIATNDPDFERVERIRVWKP